MTSPTFVASISVRFSVAAPNSFVFELSANAPCDEGNPFLNNTCSNCGIIPDPYRFERIPKLAIDKLKLETGDFVFLNNY